MEQDKKEPDRNGARDTRRDTVGKDRNDDGRPAANTRAVGDSPPAGQRGNTRQAEEKDAPKPAGDTRAESAPTGVSASAAAGGGQKKKGRSLLSRWFPAVILLVIGVAGYSLWKASQQKGFGDGFAGGNGRLEATEIDISTKLAGRITEIRVDEGDFVTQGQVLALMQTDVLEAQYLEAQAQVAKAKAAETSARAEVAVKLSDVNAAVATVAQRESELDQTQRRLGRSQVLSQKGVITGQQYDDDETTEMAAKAAVETAKAQVDVAQASVEAARADLLGATATIKAAEATAASILADIRDCSLVAPRNGRVQYRIAQPGEVLAAGGKVLNFVDLSDVYMNFFLPAAEAGKVKIGGEARILLDAFPNQPLPATITYVAATAQFTPKTVETESERQKLMFRVKAKVDKELLENNLELVKTGLPGVAWVRLDPSQPWPEELAAKITGPLVPTRD